MRPIWLSTNVPNLIHVHSSAVMHATKIFELLLILAILTVMKRLSIYFLAFVTFWMSTWMVTDIHEWAIADANQPHSVYAAQQTQSVSDSQSTTHDHFSHSGICSYDHGGHMGQTLATLSFVAVNIPAQATINFSLYPDLWYSRNILPGLRPPIT